MTQDLTKIVSVEDHVPGLPQIPIVAQAEDPIGDVNLLMDRVSLTNWPFDSIVIGLARDLIQTTKGVMPTFEVKPVQGPSEEQRRIIVRWRIRRPISQEELFSIHHFIQTGYGRAIAGHKPRGKGWNKIITHTEIGGRKDSRKKGIYFGPSEPTQQWAIGVFVSRRFANAGEAAYLREKHPEDWLARSVEQTNIVTDIELRDGFLDAQRPGLRQEQFLQTVVQIAYILKRQKCIDQRTLAARTFKELNRVGARSTEREKLYGMTDVLRTIERVLLLPLQHPNLAREYRFGPESILMAGVPGTGKTLLEYYLMTADYNAIFASVDSDQLKEDIAKGGNSTILLRADRIKEATSLPVILLIDDIDVILDQKEVVSKFLNMMQGIRQKGLYILASTNHPEKIDSRLLEPGRLSRVLHVELPDKDERIGVLGKHFEELPFVSQEEKISIITQMAAKTAGWTQRYLWELRVEASRICGLQVSENGKQTQPLTNQHFKEAYESLSQSINLKTLHEWDERIHSFVSHHRIRAGFVGEKEDRS